MGGHRGGSGVVYYSGHNCCPTFLVPESFALRVLAAAYRVPWGELVITEFVKIIIV